ncbi:MAG: response regulator transcription factor [SAR324 cluster bacterium]|nr:response regulator transcription factor [SAR324 cluster bacterium]
MKTYNVLAVDDSLTSLLFLQQVFKKEKDFFLKTAYNADEVWRILASQSIEYDLLIVDRMMPGISGDQLVKNIRKKKGPNQEIPVIMLSAKDSHDEMAEGIEMGADYYLSKPYDKEILLQYARSAIVKYRKRKQEWFQIQQERLSNYNKDCYINFMVGSSNYEDPDSLLQFSFESIKKFKFENWPTMEVSMLSREDGIENGRSDRSSDISQLGAMDKSILKKALQEFVVESESSLSTVYGAWAILWDFEDDIDDASGLAILIHNFPSPNASDPSVLKEREFIRGEIQDVVAKVLERTSELLQKMSTQRKLEEANVLLETQKASLEKEREHIKKIVTYSTNEFEKISMGNDQNQERQMELWENAIEALNDSFDVAKGLTGDPAEVQETQIALWENTKQLLNDCFNGSLGLFTELQPTQQTFMNTLTQLKALYDDTVVNENLTPGEMSDGGEDKQQGVDDLLASLGL